MPMKGILFVGLFALAVYAIAFIVDRIVPLPRSRKSLPR